MNDDKYNSSDVAIFNAGQAGVVENVTAKVVKKQDSDPERWPDYRVTFNDGKGEVNEGFYYQETDSKAFQNYQAQRIRNLAIGVMGPDFKFPLFNSAKECLDKVMAAIAPTLNKATFRVVVDYGNPNRPSRYLILKSFGSFLENTAFFEESDLQMSRNALAERPNVQASSDTEVETATAEVEDEPDWLKD